MKYPYSVKQGGKIYRAGEEVPAKGKEKSAASSAKKRETKSEAVA